MAIAGDFTCETCGREGKQTGSWVVPNLASGGFITGLDPDNCEGCAAIFEANGLVAGTIQRDARGRLAFVRDEGNADET